jgi:hypothetical protein
MKMQGFLLAVFMKCLLTFADTSCPKRGVFVSRNSGGIIRNWRRKL